MLGKKLLEKNSNLERKLRQLENFAEDTMETNQVSFYKHQLIIIDNRHNKSFNLADQTCHTGGLACKPGFCVKL